MGQYGSKAGSSSGSSTPGIPRKTTWKSMKSRLRTGDLILFKSARPSPISGAEEWCSALVVIKLLRENRLVAMTASQNLVTPASLLSHAESGKVSLVDVDAKIFSMIAPGEAQYSEVCMMQLKNFSLDSAKVEALGEWLKSLSSIGTQVLHEGVPADMAQRLSQSREPVVDASDIFATQLAANCYHALGLVSSQESDKGAAYMKVSSLENASLRGENVSFSEPLIIGTDDADYSRQRSWKNTISEHGDWGRHSAHKQTVESQLDDGISIPAIPQQSLDIGMRLISEATIEESKNKGNEADQKKQVASRNLRKKGLATLEIALMNELYYGTNSAEDQKRISEIRDTLNSNELEGHEGLSGGRLLDGSETGIVSSEVVAHSAGESKSKSKSQSKSKG